MGMWRKPIGNPAAGNQKGRRMAITGLVSGLLSLYLGLGCEAPYRTRDCQSHFRSFRGQGIVRF